MLIESIILSEVRLRKPKAPCSPLYMDYRPKTNAVILWAWAIVTGGHTLEG
jgi:hypothetical protein